MGKWRACRSCPSPTSITCNVSSSSCLNTSSVMEVLAPFPCTEAAWPTLLPISHTHETSSCWTKGELFSGGKKPCCIPMMIPVCRGVLNLHPIILEMNGVIILPEVFFFSEECFALKFLVTTTSKGGLDVYIASQIFHVRKHLSVVDPVVQMVLSASCDTFVSVFREDVCAFCCPKSMVPKGMLDMAKKTHTSQITKQAHEVHTKTGAPGDGGVGFLQGSGDFISLIADADNHQTPRYFENNNVVLIQSNTSSGGSGSKPNDDINMQQQQQQQQQQQKQQHVGYRVTGVRWPFEVARTYSVINHDCQLVCPWETMTGAMNSMYLSETMNLNNNSRCKTVSRMAAAEYLNKQRFLEDPNETPHSADGGPELHSIFCSSVTAQDSISTAMKDPPPAISATWIVASAATHHATGNRALLSDFTLENGDMFLFGGDAGAMAMQVVGYGVVVTETIVLPHVWYVPGLAANLVSVSQLAELDYSVAFGRGNCYVRSSANRAVIGAARAGEDGLFALDFLRVPLGL